MASQPSVTTPRTDFITIYADCTDVFEAPRSFNEVGAIHILASILNKQDITIRNGEVRYSLDVWTLLLSPSGTGRSTLQNMAYRFLPEGIDTTFQYGSAIGMQQQLSNNPHASWCWGEFGEVLARLNKGKFTAAKEWLTDRFDSFRLPAPVKYRERTSSNGESSGTPPLEFAEPPRINIFAVSSEEWFFQHLSDTDTTGGFVGRFSPLRVSATERDVATPPPLDERLVKEAKALIQKIAALHGQADVSRILASGAYQRWYEETKRRFKSQANKRLATAFFNRHRGTVLKLAVIFQVSEFQNLVVSETAWERAVEFALKIETAIFSLLPTGMSARGFEIQKAEQLILEAGKEGLSKNTFTRSTQHLDSKERDDILKTLEDSGQIIIKVHIPPKGRPKKQLFHITCLGERGIDGPLPSN